ncbi:MAG TPA: carbon storage regulator CsrA [Clostridia bacterium]|nr:carbon storage regulator CsrA [Clostridia bacterium]
MLVLSRKAGEILFIGKDISIEILGVEGDRVRIGINAPKETRIFRKELMDATIEANKSAVNAPAIGRLFPHGSPMNGEAE